MMTWLLMWLNVSVATLNATLQLIVIYRLFVLTRNFCQRTKRNPSNRLHTKGHSLLTELKASLHPVIHIWTNALPFYIISTLVSQILGLDICADTLVGDAMRRYLWWSEKEIDNR